MVTGLRCPSDKYQPRGVTLELDAAELVAGGRTLMVKIAYAGQTRLYEGTLTRDGLSFYESRETNGVAEAWASGPRISHHHFSADHFRDFLCERTILLVRSVMRNPNLKVEA